MNNAQAFWKQVESDKALEARLEAVKFNGNDVVAIAADAGYAVTVHDLKAAADALYGELTDSDLENIAGGGIVVDERGKKYIVIIPENK